MNNYLVLLFMPVKRTRTDFESADKTPECDPIDLTDHEVMPQRDTKRSFHGQLVLAVSSRGGALTRLPRELEELILEGKELIDCLKVLSGR